MNVRAIARISPFLILAVAVITLPPAALSTRTYPLVVVEGNSMLPTLPSGYMVIYRGTHLDKIQNGTIIVFQSSGTGFSIIDYMIRPIIVHRVVGQVVQSDGTVYYRTKGDNNQFEDPGLVRSDQVLGEPIAIVPVIGAVVLFFRSPQGIVFAVAAIVFLYLGKYDRAIARDKKKRELLAIFAKMTLDGRLSLSRFEKLKLATEYADELAPEMKNPALNSLSEWLRASGVGGKWTEEQVTCPKCSKPAMQVKRQDGEPLLLCPLCTLKTKRRLKPNLDTMLRTGSSRVRLRKNTPTFE